MIRSCSLWHKAEGYRGLGRPGDRGRSFVQPLGGKAFGSVWQRSFQGSGGPLVEDLFERCCYQCADRTLVAEQRFGRLPTERKGLEAVDPGKCLLMDQVITLVAPPQHNHQ